MLRTCVLSCAVMGLLGLAVGCKVESTPTSVTVSTQEAAIKDAEAKLKMLEGSLADLEAKAKVATGEEKAKLEAKWKASADKRAAASKKLEELKAATKEKWQEVHKEALREFDELKKAVQ